MKKLFVMMAVIATATMAQADGKWYEEGFVQNAKMEMGEEGKLGPDAAMMLDDLTQPGWQRPRKDTQFKCNAVRNAIYKNQEAYMNMDQNHYCQVDSDCAIANIGGFCGGAYHKTVVEAFKLWRASTTYNELHKVSMNNGCHRFGPVGLCMPVNKVVCNRSTNKCEGQWGQEPTDPPSILPEPVLPPVIFPAEQ